MKNENDVLAANERKKTEENRFLNRSEADAALIMAEVETGVNSEQDPDAWAKVFGDLTDLIGINSTGGNSVTDVAMERDR